MKKVAPKMTLEKLSSAMEKGFKRQDANLEKLAMMVANGFARTDEKFEKIEKDLQVIRRDILAQNDKFVSQDTFNTRISSLEVKVKTKIK